MASLRLPASAGTDVRAFTPYVALPRQSGVPCFRELGHVTHRHVGPGLPEFVGDGDEIHTPPIERERPHRLEHLARAPVVEKFQWMETDSLRAAPFATKKRDRGYSRNALDERKNAEGG